MEVPEPIRVMVVDRHELIRAGIARLVESDSGVVTVASCGGIPEALSTLVATPVSVVVLDYEPGTSQRVIDMIALSRDKGFSGVFLVMTAELHDNHALSLLKHGVAGIISKSDQPEVLIKAIRRVHEGGWWVTDEHIKLMIDSIALNNTEPQKDLSPRERTVLRAVVEGQSNKQIATDLGVTEGAIKSTLQHLFRKTGTRKRGQLIRIAMDRFGF
jgi:two-component system nitrate/nitrite response regulator NarL